MSELERDEEQGYEEEIVEEVDIEGEIVTERAVVRGQKKPSKENEETFTGEEKLLHKLTNLKSEITLERKEIAIDDIIMSQFKKSSRLDTITGLTGVVGNWGVVSPIHVLALEDEDCYQLLDGLRRVYAALRRGDTEITAVVWDFTDKREGKEVANVLSLMINRNQIYTPKEMWEQMQVLESVNDATPHLIEYLLQMEPGDAMKLKDVMMAEEEYSEYRIELMAGKYGIEQAYKKLCNHRKKEDKLAKEDKQSVDQEGLKTDNGLEDKIGLDPNEVSEILELTETNIDDKDIEDLNRTDEIRKEDMHQKTGERTFIDPEVKKATLMRDDFTCRACKKISGHNGWNHVLVYHHLIPVFAGGPDTVENGLTLCVNCHLTLHNYITGDLQVDINSLQEGEKETFKNIFKYGNVAIEAAKRKGMKRDAVKKADKGSKKHPFPNQFVKENDKALAEAKEDEK